MEMLEQILKIEEEGWRALSSEGNAAQDFYSGVLRADAMMLFPGGIRLEGREDILASMAAQPWQHFQIEDPKVLQMGNAVCVLAYKVTAQRDGRPPYEALISSTYENNDGAWKLVAHQHTPI